MSSGGKYVCAPEYQSDTEDSDESISDEPYIEELNDEGHVSGNDNAGTEDEQGETEHPIPEKDGVKECGEGSSHDGDEETNNAAHSATNGENQKYIQQMRQLQDTLNHIMRTMEFNRPINRPNEPTTNQLDQRLDEVDRSWNLDSEFPGPSSSSASVRWQNIQPFPDDVAASKMWEQWHRFIDRFEIAVSLANINDPVKRTHTLFLSLGEKLQGIARAANLRPSLKNPNCYAVFVKNLENYLRSMVDVTAEHAAFTNMKQEPAESTLAFHARLKEKIRLVGYTIADQDQSVYTQLLRGMRNKELVKAARTFGYSASFVVQCATREEAYTAETEQLGSSQAFAVQRNRRQASKESQWKRKREQTDDDVNQRKKRNADDSRDRGLGRRSRCSKCNMQHHRFGACPAEKNSCRSCGKRGHFEAVCWKKVANAVQTERNLPQGWSKEEDENIKHINAICLTDALIDCRVGSSNPICFLIDSGADVNTIGGDDWKRLKHEFHVGTAKLEPFELSKDSDLRPYASSKPLSVTRAFRAIIEVVGHDKPLINAEFLVIDQGTRSLLGRSTASDLKLLKVGVSVNSCEGPENTATFPKVPSVLVKIVITEHLC
ncbi:uncharacterized protein LOC129761695 [Toxorhynchites rutilus septentrionalis]|uniref:uncharacterized protein LOC129761695 n=1 Tax=Toxorhynchites rutilus septentrionalis TaxID=329112 RepID=UPI0024797CB7|nr:uncharacterized protein LOC129761695 [Toxorhynchites rutilus septentrionalis]